MEQSFLIIAYPNRPGFILLSHELKLIISEAFNHEAVVELTNNDSFVILCEGREIYAVHQPKGREDIEIKSIVNILKKYVPMVRSIDLGIIEKTNKTSAIEKEWRYSVCSGE